VAAAGLPGCGAGAGESSSDVRLLVTRDFGRTALVREQRPELRGADTVMRLLQRNAEVTTRFGGGFVQSIGGLSGGQRAGRPVDWFFYVDGSLSESGAAEVRVRDGARIWWDHHDWGAGTGGSAAVVGSFPAPFARRRVRLACVPARTDACGRTRAALVRGGARVDDAAPPDVGRGEGPGVLVGAYAAIRAVPAARTLEGGPEASGVYARPARDGRSLAVLDERGRRVRTLRAGAGLVAATRAGDRPAVWSITGTDEAGVLAAAGALGERRLGARFAVAVAGGEDVALPAEARG
jgi:hypothetical protein